MPGGAGTGFRSVEPDEHRPAGRIANVAHRPVAALAPPIGQVMAADRLGITGEAARQFGSVAGHHETPRSALTLCCVEAVDRLWESAQSRERNITFGATYSVLCSIEHKTDAATGEHGDLIDLIAGNRGLASFRDACHEARRFLSLPRLPLLRHRCPRAACATAGGRPPSVSRGRVHHRHAGRSLSPRARHHRASRLAVAALSPCALVPERRRRAPRVVAGPARRRHRS